ncbi:MAG: GNAT family N-acetyltransferase [Oscillospiraceae bacterium]
MSKTGFLPAQPQDTPALRALWQQVFGDEESFISQSLLSFAGPGQVYVAKQQEKLVAQLLAVPCNMGGQSGVYLYALATAPSARGQGVMGGLMAYAEEEERQKGAVFSALIPAGAALYAYYEKRGYAQTLWLRRVLLAPEAAQPGEDLPGVQFARPDAEGFAALREKYIQCPYINFTPGRYAPLLQDLYSQGAVFAINSGGYAVYMKTEDSVLVVELFAQNDAQAKAILCAIQEKTGCGGMALTLAQQPALFAGQGVLQPAGLLKPLQSEFVVKYPYIRFGFDELE